MVASPAQVHKTIMPELLRACLNSRLGSAIMDVVDSENTGTRHDAVVKLRTNSTGGNSLSRTWHAINDDVTVLQPMTCTVLLDLIHY